MRPPHPRCTGAFVVLCGAGVLAAAAVRLEPRTLRFPPDDPPGIGVPAWRIDLDRAPASELALLPGVGPRLADRIVQDRASRGGFGGVEGLDRVPGVGPSVIDRVRPFVR